MRQAMPVNLGCPVPQASFLVRRAANTESDAVAKLHRMVREACMPYLPVLHTPEEDRAFFRDRVFPACEVWVADVGLIVGFCAFRVGWIDHLYVDPEYHGRGLGSAVLAKAMKAHAVLELWTYQRNTQARTFYERKGFTVVELTDGSAVEEKEPDARYRWARRT